MKTTCFVQFDPTFNTNGKLIRVHAARVTRNMPDSPIPGAVVAQLNFDIPDRLFGPHFSADVRVGPDNAFVVVPYVDVENVEATKAKRPAKKKVGR